jgi:hypothetical protein
LFRAGANASGLAVVLARGGSPVKVARSKSHRCHSRVVSGRMAAAGSAPSLVTREHSATVDRWVLRRAVQPGPEHCPRFGMDLLNLATGAIRPASCKSLRCPTCGPFEVKRRVWKAARANPNAMLTMTALPKEYGPAMLVEQRFVRLVRGCGYDFQWCVAHELTKRGQRHSHALVKAPRIPQRLLSELSVRAGAGRVLWITAIRNQGATSYAMKEARRTVAYATKGTDALAEHLALNGGHVYRTTRGYWRDD